jgi:hypothetical protein
MSTPERMENMPEALSKVLNEIMPAYEEDYKKNVLRWWVKDKQMREISIGNYKIRLQKGLIDKTGFGITNKFMKVFPIIEITEELGNLDDSIWFMTQVIASTAYSSSTVETESTLALLTIKINTRQTIDESKNLQKVISEVTCGLVEEESYIKLANKSEDVDITVFF